MKHLQQPRPYGCPYYALASLTGYTSLLEHAADLSFSRFTLRAMRAGYLIQPLHVASQSSRMPVGEKFWRTRTWVLELGAVYRYLLTIRSLKYRAVDHVVGLIVEWEPVLQHVSMIVTDPGQPHAIYYGKEEFICSPYARAMDVMQVLPADLRRLQKQDPQELEPLTDPIDPLANGGRATRMR